MEKNVQKKISSPPSKLSEDFVEILEIEAEKKIIS